MSPPTNGIQASAAAMLDGNPVDCVVGFVDALKVREADSGGGMAPAQEEVRSARKDQPWYC